jgi:hypothetical protein
MGLPRFTSGFAFKEDGSYLFLVNTKYYRLKDDVICFELSRNFHHMQNMIIECDYKIMRANIKDRHGNGWDFWIDFDDNGKEEFRVYEVIESNE